MDIEFEAASRLLPEDYPQDGFVAVVDLALFNNAPDEGKIQVLTVADPEIEGPGHILVFSGESELALYMGLLRKQGNYLAMYEALGRQMGSPVVGLKRETFDGLLDFAKRSGFQGLYVYSQKRFVYAL